MNVTYLRPCMVLALLSSLLLARAALATENGLQHYPLGSNTILSGMMPARGTMQFYNYTLYYRANKLVGNNGQSTVSNFKTVVKTDALRVIRTWDVALGPFEVSTGIVLPLVHTKLNLPFGSDSRGGLGDVVWQNFFSWKKPEDGLFTFLALDIALPSADYSANRIANVGLNSYGVIPNAVLTWFPDSRTEISAGVGYIFHSPNRKTRYHSGNVAFFEGAIAYAIAPDWRVGLSGYVLKQTTDDKSNGALVKGFRGQALALGPQIRFNLGRQSAIALEWQPEFKVRNRAQGDKFWMKFSFPL